MFVLENALHNYRMAFCGLHLLSGNLQMDFVNALVLFKQLYECYQSHGHQGAHFLIWFSFYPNMDK